MNIAAGGKSITNPAPLAEGSVRLNGHATSLRLHSRHRVLVVSFLLCVLLPAFSGAIYYISIASNRYVAGAGFAIRSTEAASTDAIGAMTGLNPAQSTASDAYMLLGYLRSRDIVERLMQEFPLWEHFASDKVDRLSRLEAESSIETLVAYWNRRIRAHFNSASGIVTFEVEAFDPQSAERLASLVLDYCRDMVNHLSGEARRDAVAFTTAEVERAEARLKSVLEAIRRFRETEQSLDPAGAARIRLELVGGLERQLADLRARISALQASLDRDAPLLRSLTRQAEALEQQIARERVAMTAEHDDQAGSATLSDQLAVYETLEVERTFAQQYYASALSSLEAARVNADRHQRYLAVYSNPAAPQEATHPRRFLNTLLLTAALTLLWGIGALIGYAVRDHLS